LTNARYFNSILAEYHSIVFVFRQGTARCSEQQLNREWKKYRFKNCGATPGIFEYGSIGQTCPCQNQAFGMVRRVRTDLLHPMVFAMLCAAATKMLLRCLFAESDYLVVPHR
jgi:phosphoglycerate dehydrogenase-like enzyme